MSGPHQTPFACETKTFGFGPPLDTDCTIATRVDYFYRASGEQGNPFKPYDINGTKPADLDVTTRVEGKTAPYISAARLERSIARWELNDRSIATRQVGR